MFVACASHKTVHHQIAQGCHDLEPARGTDLGTVFVEVQVANPVEPVLDPQWPQMMAASSAAVGLLDGS
jgi:hypothetical protein